MITNTIKAIQK